MDGAVYEYIFEKQSGVNGSFQLEIKAPRSFIWKENKQQTFVYKNDFPPRRIDLKLTLEKIGIPILVNSGE